ncbi:hypothetical protein JCM10207_000480 [Rhodosporidiobolus poonsookiae]
MATIVVSSPDPDSPRESTSSSQHPPPSEPMSTTPLHANQGHLAVPGQQNTATAEGDQPRGRPRSASAVTAIETTLLNPDHPPQLDFHFGLKGPIIYFIFLVICNVVIPVILYYPLRATTDLSDKELIGIGSAALGLSSCFDAPFRMWKLTRHRAKYGPLYYPYAPDPAFEPAGKNRLMKVMPRSWWHLDFFMWTYQIGLLVFAIPLAIAPSIPLYNFFLFSFAMLVIPIGIIFLLTLKSWHNLPFWMSSDPPRTSTKPAVYYFIEDVGAVDFCHGREWRKRCQARYAASPPFRAMMWQQTLFWSIAMVIFVGLTAVVDWISSLNVAFGVVISLIFMWAIVFGILSYLLVHRSLKKELAWWKAEYAGLVREHRRPRSASSVHSTEREVAPAPPASTGEAGPTELASAEAGAGAGPGSVSEDDHEFLGEKGLSKPGKVAQGRHRGWSVHARLTPTPEPVLPGSTSSAGSTAPPSPEMQQVSRTPSPVQVRVRDSAGRTVAVGGKGEKVPGRIAEGEDREREEGERERADRARTRGGEGKGREGVEEKDWAAEEKRAQEGTNGSPV